MKLLIDPYKLLFPLGGLAGLLGIILWPLFNFRFIQFYPREPHAAIMFFGFLWSFVAGFLMTAIPRMTQSSKASSFEIYLATLFVAGQVLVNYIPSIKLSIFIFIFQTLFLVIFILRRFLVHKRVPFFGAIFIPFAFLQCLAGVTIYLFTEHSLIANLFLLSGEAFILNLILGVGSRLIPVISRLPNAVMPDALAPENKMTATLCLALILNSSFYMQIFYSERIGLAMRLGVVLWLAARAFRIYLKPEQNTYLGIGLRLGVLFLMVSYGAALYEGASSLSAQHLLFIGGFILITLMVGTRVVLAHGGMNLDYELQSKRILLVIFFVVAAAVLRFLAGANFSGDLMLAAVLSLGCALLLWIWKAIRVHLESTKLS